MSFDSEHVLSTTKHILHQTYCLTHQQQVVECATDAEHRLAEIAQIIDEAMREDGYTAVIKVRDRERIRQLAKGTEKC